jgi:hypothetical protein
MQRRHASDVRPAQATPATPRPSRPGGNKWRRVRGQKCAVRDVRGPPHTAVSGSVVVGGGGPCPFAGPKAARRMRALCGAGGWSYPKRRWMDHGRMDGRLSSRAMRSRRVRCFLGQRGRSSTRFPPPAASQCAVGPPTAGPSSVPAGRPG